MFERFTERARQVVVLAQDEARLLKHNYIGTEHELLGLIREEDGVAARVLATLGVTLELVREEVRRIVGTGDGFSSGQIPFTPRAKRVLELAMREALSLGHDYIGTEHILLGLVREGEGVANAILLDLGADPDNLRSGVLQLLSDPAAAPEERPAEIELTSPPFAREFLDELARLAEEKEEAIASQNFEEAARLRNRERRLTMIARAFQRDWERS
jgi:ATP-dependent Clp protease ATP-binding subunit ClpA